MTLDLKAKYRESWDLGNAREGLAEYWLKNLLGVADLVSTGHGTLNAESLPGFHTCAEDRFDFYSPLLRCYFEVTGTDWRRHESARRYGKPVLAILKAKVDSAAEYGLTDSLWFVSVNEMQGEIRLYPCAWITPDRHSLLNYAKGEGAFYGIPWDQWMTPARAQGHLMKRLTKEAGK